MHRCGPRRLPRRRCRRLLEASGLIGLRTIAEQQGGRRRRARRAAIILGRLRGSRGLCQRGVLVEMPAPLNRPRSALGDRVRDFPGGGGYSTHSCIPSVADFPGVSTFRAAGAFPRNRRWGEIRNRRLLISPGARVTLWDGRPPCCEPDSTRFRFPAALEVGLRCGFSYLNSGNAGRTLK